MDPMHALMLGLIKKEASIHFDDDTNSDTSNFAITQEKKEILKKRLKSIKMPSDCGRLPTTILDKASVEGTTAQQWLLYAKVYARPCLVNLLPLDSYKCMKLLCEITDIISKHMITQDDILTLEMKVQQHHKLFCRLYGKWKMSINNHMMLHMANSLKDFGPSHTFWCFGYERMNGILVGVPSSGRSVEKELIKRFECRQSLSFEEPEQHLSNQLRRHLEDTCPELQSMKDSSLEEDEIAKMLHDDEIERLSAEVYLRGEAAETDLYELQCKVEMQEVEERHFKVCKMLGPKRINKVMTDSLYQEVKEHLDMLYEERLLHLSKSLDKLARCKVNGVTFNSSMHRSETSSTAVVYGALEEQNDVEKYHCKIQYFFNAKTIVKDPFGIQHGRELPFAYVNWYRPSSKRIDVKSGLHQTKTTFHRDSHIVGVHILCQRVVSMMISSDLTMIPI